VPRVIPFRTGNLSVQRLHAARHGEPLPDPREERELLAGWGALGFDAVEDYVAWQLVEPRPGEWDWSLPRGNAQAAARAGLRYVAYPWVHAAPDWHVGSADWVPSRCLQHGADSALPSPWAPSTWLAAERFWRALAAALRDVLHGVVLAWPADYGEFAHGSGTADWLIGKRQHQHPGLWCDEEPARAAWRDQVRALHDTPARLAAAWLLPESAFDAPPFPGRDAPLPQRAAFARFYAGAVQDGARRLLALAEELFPDLPREIKLGHCSEALELGSDWHALVGLAARGRAAVCFTGAAQGELFTRRIASLCRDHGVPLLTEAPREIPVWLLHERAFVDVAAGARGLFEFPEQLAAARSSFDAVRPALGRQPQRPPVGCLYATTDLALSPGHGAPDALAHAFPALRRACDLDLLDERQVLRGSLAGLAGLIWLDGEHAPRAALAALARWVSEGGVLIASAPQAPQLLDDDGAPSAPRDDEATRLAALLPPAPGSLHLVLDLPDGTPIVWPGEDAARVLLGTGWHGREDGRWAFPDAIARPGAGDGRGAVPLDHWTEPGEPTPLPCRWTGPAAEMLLPVPLVARSDPRACELRVELCVPPAAPHAPLRLWLDGEPLEPFAGRGAQTLVRPLPRAPGGDLAMLRLLPPTHVPHRDWGSPDRRELGALVRRAWIPARGAASGSDEVADLLPAQHTLRARPEGAACVAFGRGAVLRGDGTPLAALALLNAWLAGELPGAPPPPDPPRDALQHCLVSALDGGLLVHNPHPHAPARPQIVGSQPHATRRLTVWNSLRPWSLLAPLQTRWVE